MKTHRKPTPLPAAAIGAIAVAVAIVTTGIVALRAQQAAPPVASARGTGDCLLETKIRPDGGAMVQFASRPYRIDRIFESMQGPYSVHSPIDLPELAESGGGGGGGQRAAKVTWVRGITTQVVDDASLSPADQGLFCHSNLELMLNADTAASREAMLGVSADGMDSRLFTLVPGRLSLRLPDGFALPVFSGEQVMYQSMVLNLNDPDLDESVRIRTEVEILPHDATVRPLYRRALYTLQTINPDVTTALTAEEAEMCGCGPGESLTASNDSVLPQFGLDKTLHWYVPQGDHTYTQDVTQQLSLPFDTTIHYATVHLHPKGKWAELRDITAGQTVLTLHATDFADRRGIETVEEISSEQGIRLYADHKYELVTRYENDTGGYIDAMSILYLYLAGEDRDEGS